jgi:hypothetical protein
MVTNVLGNGPAFLTRLRSFNPTIGVVAMSYAIDWI